MTASPRADRWNRAEDKLRGERVVRRCGGLPARDRDEIKRPHIPQRAGRVPARRGEKISRRSPLGAIAHRGVADFLGRDDAETIARQIVEARKSVVYRPATRSDPAAAPQVNS
jgi:hypothetical protein